MISTQIQFVLIKYKGGLVLRGCKHYDRKIV